MFQQYDVHIWALASCSSIKLRKSRKQYVSVVQRQRRMVTTTTRPRCPHLRRRRKRPLHLPVRHAQPRLGHPSYPPHRHHQSHSPCRAKQPRRHRLAASALGRSLSSSTGPADGGGFARLLHPPSTCCGCVASRDCVATQAVARRRVSAVYGCSSCSRKI